MGSLVFFLCSVLSVMCTVLLYKGFLKSKFKLLFWCSIGFGGFALGNVLSLIDTITGPTFDLSIVRTIPSLIGIIIMTFGLIQESV